MVEKFSRDRAELIGKIILAKFIGLSLEKYEKFIHGMEREVLWGERKGIVTSKKLSGAEVMDSRVLLSRQAIGMIRKNGTLFSIYYRHPGFTKEYLFDKEEIIKEMSDFSETDRERLETLLRRLRLITTRNRITHETLRGISIHQASYFHSGDPLDLRPLSQAHFSRWLNGGRSTENPKSKIVIDSSRISRVVAGKSILTPQGEEFPLKFFFPTQRKIDKIFIRRLLNREGADINAGKIRRPYSDEEIKDKLTKEYGLSISRRRVAFCRKEMGIPPYYKRDDEKYPPKRANFSPFYPLTFFSVENSASSKSGVYELRLRTGEIEYPRGSIGVFYIGSAKNIKERLKDHLRLSTKNEGIKNYLKNYDCLFRYISFTNGWNIEEKRLYNLFVASFGGSPECNIISP